MYYSRPWREGIVSQVTLAGFRSALPPILEARAPLVVLTAGRGEATELEVALVQDPITVLVGLAPGCGAQGKNHIGHYCCGLPLSGRDPRIEMSVSGLQ
jgi:hypothetical protein